MLTCPVAIPVAIFRLMNARPPFPAALDRRGIGRLLCRDGSPGSPIVTAINQEAMIYSISEASSQFRTFKKVSC